MTTTKSVLLDEGHRARFWSKVDKSRGADACWPWTAYRMPSGYGTFGLDGRLHELAHRVAWVLTRGPIPDGICVLHACDNPPCVNPNHLWLGTIADNNADKVAKGRACGGTFGDSNGARTRPERLARGGRHWARLHPERVVRGEQHRSAKLTEDDVRLIRQRYAGGETQEAIHRSRSFPVSRVSIRNVLLRRTWAHVE